MKQEMDSLKYFPLDERLHKIDLIADSVDIEYCVKYDAALQVAEAELRLLSIHNVDLIKDLQAQRIQLADKDEAIERWKESNEKLKKELGQAHDHIRLLMDEIAEMNKS